MATKQYKTGEVIFYEKDAANCMYDIYWGKVGIFSDYGGKNQRLLTELEDDAFFGEMGLINAEPRSATAVALEDTQLEEISEEEFSAYFRDKPMRVLMIMRQMGRRIRELSQS